MQSKLTGKEKEKLLDQLYERDGHICHYCGIEEKDFIKKWGIFRYGRRGRRLEVDHKDNGEGDDIKNCVLACYACNNAKSDVFTYEEFKRVGAVIRKIWQKRKAGVTKQPLIGQ